LSEELVDPASAAEAKAIQFLQIAVMAAEGLAVLATARAEARVARTEVEVERLVSSIETTRGAAEPLWRPAVDPALQGQLTEKEALTAWAASQPWSGVDPAAADASRASLVRLRELDPAAADALDALRTNRAAPTEATISVVSPLARSSTAAPKRGRVIHSSAEAVAASYPAPLTTAAAHASAARTIAATTPTQVSAAAKSHTTNLGR
jgi:hypothetical protein